MMTADWQPDGKIDIDIESDIVTVRRTIRDAAVALGFGLTDITRIVTAASELSRNIYRFAQKGVVYWKIERQNCDRGITIVFDDHGPGIGNIEEALRMGHTTGGGLGLGLPGAKRLMDEMEIESTIGGGTRICVRKWLNGK